VEPPHKMTWLALSVTSSKQRFVVKEQNPQGKYQGYTWLALSVTCSKQISCKRTKSSR